MLFENKIGKSFNNVASRIIYNIAIQMAPYKPINNDFVKEESQHQFYSFLCDFYKKIYEDPTIIGMDILPDETEDRPLEGKNYLDTRKTMRAQQKKLDNLFNWLIICGDTGHIENSKLVVTKKASALNKAKLAIFNNIGINSDVEGDTFILWNDTYPDMMYAIKYISSICRINNNPFYLSRCIFDLDYPYLWEIYAVLSNEPILYKELLDYVKQKDFEVAYTYNPEFGYGAVKIVNDMRIMFISYYDNRFYNQLLFTFIDDKNVYKELLPRFSELDEDIQELFYKNTKKCNGCGFCNQRNKTAPLAFISAEYKGEKINFCYFFQYIRFQYLSKDTLQPVMKLYSQLL